MTEARGLSLSDVGLYLKESTQLLSERDGALAGDLEDQGIGACLSSLKAAEFSPRIEPLRTLHHFAATGGTLFSKLIAALPNVLVLSELHPCSPRDPGGVAFRPSDIAFHIRAAELPESGEVAEHAFITSLIAVGEQLAKRGTRLVVRDHAHSDFCDFEPGKESTLLRLLSANEVETLTIVTVRHPADSFVSTQKKQWFPPSIDFADYCKRYHRFLDGVHAALIVRYEDMIDEPYDWLEKICDAWKLDYTPESVNLFNLYQFSGDSGRSRDVLTKHPSRPEAAQLRRSKSKVYTSLLARLGY